MKLTLLAAGFAGGVLALAGTTAAAAGTGGGGPGPYHPVTLTASWSEQLAYQDDTVVLTAVADQPSVPEPSITITATVPADALKPADGAGCRTDAAANTVTCTSTSYRKAPFRFVVKTAEPGQVVAAVTAQAGTGDSRDAAAALPLAGAASPSPSASTPGSPSASPSTSPSGSVGASPSGSAAAPPSGSPSGSTGTSPGGSAPAAAGPPSGGGLPVTGTSLTAFGVLAAALLAAGGALLVLARRRRSAR